MLKYYRGLGASGYYGDEKCYKSGDFKFVNANGDDCVIKHGYYQWIPYVLMMQVYLFLSFIFIL